MNRIDFLDFMAGFTLVMVIIAASAIIGTCIRIRNQGGVLYTVEHGYVKIDNVERWIGCKP